MSQAKRTSRWVGFFLVVSVCGPPGLAAAAGRLTAALGTTSGDQVLHESSAVEDGAGLDTDDDGGCSVLVDEDVLMEVCENTSLQLERKDGARDGARIVKLDRGEIRLVVEPRLGEEKIEIHTPAAIATVLGTILRVAVDANGVTTITSEESRVLVESADASLSGATTIQGGQQVVVEPGQAPPPRPEQLSPRAIAGLGGCWLDFGEAALRAARLSGAQDQIDETVAEDIAAAGLPEEFSARLKSLRVGGAVAGLDDSSTNPPFPTRATPPDPRSDIYIPPTTQDPPGSPGGTISNQGP